MTEKLPISIDACDNLMQQFVKITSVCNKLEAQFNFQTMRANWYGDEDNILFVQLCIETPKNFALQKKGQRQALTQNYSDDAFSYFQRNEKQQTLVCHIAITEAEMALLSQQHKLLSALLHIKLQKVLNLIAKQLKFNVI